ncbi:hypothetical protein Pmani_016674 [Petrolisthes manimaculis]|uniref:Uncharacterized protein n=1 Tax=Petrolisthes manimaculis TaxID=1843537 RepID=A0AAE1PR66_9EUCA|nr:hypothetical protein Pmani_016674 [Petrolisthes manimaculis]
MGISCSLKGLARTKNEEMWDEMKEIETLHGGVSATTTAAPLELSASAPSPMYTVSAVSPVVFGIAFPAASAAFGIKSAVTVRELLRVLICLFLNTPTADHLTL